MADLCTKDYVARHDRIVNLFASTVKEVFPENVIMYKHAGIISERFNSSIDVFS